MMQCFADVFFGSGPVVTEKCNLGKCRECQAGIRFVAEYPLEKPFRFGKVDGLHFKLSKADKKLGILPLSDRFFKQLEPYIRILAGFFKKKTDVLCLGKAGAVIDKAAQGSTIYGRR